MVIEPRQRDSASLNSSKVLQLHLQLHELYYCSHLDEAINFTQPVDGGCLVREGEFPLGISLCLYMQCLPEQALRWFVEESFEVALVHSPSPSILSLG